ncbi:MAG: PAS domain S-box protein [Bacteroidota bacterium]
MKQLPTILIVDDIKENLLLLETIIRKIDVNLIQALSGYEALKKTRGIELALTIIDVRMPGMNGYELALKINEERPGVKVPVIFLTASHFSEIELIKGYGFGAVDYIFKPINNHILLSKIKVFLELFNQKQIILSEAELLQKSIDELARVNVELTLAKSQADAATQRYSELYDFAPSGYFTLSAEKAIHELNHSGALMLDKERSSLIGSHFGFFVSKNSLPLFNAFFQKVFTSKSKEICEVILETDGNKPKNVFIEGMVVGNGEQCLINVIDITGIKEAAVKLQQTRQNYLTFFNTIDELLFVLDENGNIIHTNDTGINRLGYSQEELLGKPVLMLHPVEYKDEAIRVIDEMLHGNIEYCPIPLITKTGIQIPVETRVSKGLWDGKPSIFGVSKDISQIKLSEEKFSKVFYLNPSACGLDDLVTGKYIEVNEAFYTLLGFDKNEVIGKTALELGILTPDSMKELLSKADGRETVANLEANLKAKNGDIKHTLLSSENIILQNKKYRFTVVHDITDRKLAEQTLKVSEEKYRTMLNASPDGILLIDLKRTITEVSEIALELFGADSRDDMVGKDIMQFVPSDEIHIITEIFEKTMNEGLIQNVEMIVKKRNGYLFVGETSATLIQGTEGVPLSFMVTVRDISYRKKMEAKQIHADRMSNLGEMAAGIAHEINQPLNIISMVLDKILFESAKTKSIDLEFLTNKSGKIFENITRIRNIIDNVRAFSRSHDDYILTAFNVNSAIENVILMIAEQFKHLGINIDLQLEKQFPKILGNIYKFEQVIINLLINAKDAVIKKKNKQAGIIEMNIVIKSYQENQFLVVEVADNGIGINNDEINNVMLPFYTSKDEGKGTGLGLSICYQIIKEMNGTIDVTSESHFGTKIKIVFKAREK